MKLFKTQLNTLGYGMVAMLLFGSVLTAQADTVTREDIIRLTNEERKQAGLKELVENEQLNAAAEKKAQDMIGNKYFAHTSPTGVDPWYWFEQVDYVYKYAGENLAMDFSSASSVTRAWMKSPTHRENILSDKFYEIGVAVVPGILENKETLVAVQMFGAKLGQPSTDGVIPDDTISAKIKIEEASMQPWKGSGSDELLVYAKVSGEPVKVEAIIGQQVFELKKHRDNIYMDLLLLEEIQLEDQYIMIKASEDEKLAAYHQISKQEIKEVLNRPEKKQDENLTVASAYESNNSAYVKSVVKQNLFLTGVLVLFLIVIANIWILEREDEQLLAHQPAA